METPKFNTIYTFEAVDGSKIEMTLAFYLLLQLKSKNKALYDRYNKIIVEQSKGNLDELNTIVILYVAYVCAHLKDEKLIDEEEFFMLCGSDREEVNKAVQHLTNPKKA